MNKYWFIGLVVFLTGCSANEVANPDYASTKSSGVETINPNIKYLVKKDCYHSNRLYSKNYTLKWTGKCLKGKADGFGSLYVYGYKNKLVDTFIGNMKNGNMLNGKLRDPTGNPSYEGTFKDGGYHKGIFKGGDVNKNIKYVFKGTLRGAGLYDGVMTVNNGLTVLYKNGFKSRTPLNEMSCRELASRMKLSLKSLRKAAKKGKSAQETDQIYSEMVNGSSSRIASAPSDSFAKAEAFFGVLGAVGSLVSKNEANDNLDQINADKSAFKSFIKRYKQKGCKKG